jgi:nucleotide-binding universal stress UspA family protein
VDYKTVLVDIDPSGATDGRIGFAVKLASAWQAHLVGITQTGIVRFIRDSTLSDINLAGLTPLFEQLRQDADARAAQFDALVRQAGSSDFEHRIGDEDPGNGLATQAMYADLVVVSQRDPSGAEATRDAAVPEYVAMNAPCPVIVLPWGGTPAPGFERVLVAWNASPEAARAVRQALPFLKRAKEVEVAIVGTDHAGGAPAPLGGPEIARFLTRHGIAADVQYQQGGGDDGETLLGLADERGAGLLVMGCYGHSRFRELLLGGATRTILERMRLPVLMAH